MGKKKSARGVNKSQAIRDYLAANPQASPNEVVAGLKGQGITVTYALASNVKYTRARLTGGRKRGRPPGKRGRNGALTAVDLMEAKKLADQLGGIEQARQALAALEELR